MDTRKLIDSVTIGRIMLYGKQPVLIVGFHANMVIISYGWCMRQQSDYVLRSELRMRK